MASFYDAITDDHAAFIADQPMFFVATTAPDARINLSPKGMDTFRVLSPNRVAYLDLTGSGNETAIHLRHDGRITVMFNSFGTKPLILRLYGTGRAVALNAPEASELLASVGEVAGARQVIVIDVESVQTSCGYAVPRMELTAERPTLVKWAERKTPEEIEAYQQANNQRSIDGLPLT